MGGVGWQLVIGRFHVGILGLRLRIVGDSGIVVRDYGRGVWQSGWDRNSWDDVLGFCDSRWRLGDSRWSFWGVVWEERFG